MCGGKCVGMPKRPSTIRKKILCRQLDPLSKRFEALQLEVEDAEAVRVAFDQGKTVERPAKRKKR